jgi:hypothetical protein
MLWVRKEGSVSATGYRLRRGQRLPRLLDPGTIPGRLALSPREAAEALGVSRSYFDEWVLPS